MRASLSIVNLPSLDDNLVIYMIEAVGYIAIGFAGTLAAMEAAWRMARRRSTALEMRTR